MKVKICGVATLDDAVFLSQIGIDMIGIVNEPSSPRFAKREFNRIVKSKVDKPVVGVTVRGSLSLQAEDMLQVHRVLSLEEISSLTTLNISNFIFYVPASEEGKEYLKDLASAGVKNILVDSPRKGEKTSFKVAKEILDVFPEAGVAGGITPLNVMDFVRLNPGWIDVSSGVESYPGKKDHDKVMKIKEAVRNGV
ncbi:phosphoribosylanthranilate isomerase [Sulfuracidifex tepidarius]|uniref:N-(5'-phosphoribosyl)anthranilate isomerase n=1 Tax=Sulfuracidifex tepidarius TaxID=1294262 RepID=A0A510DUB2_9CREN|nr:phosphoribosylanthranilate isomerase [Sulfuracidifex tepidarius]BBG23816.1 N-(5'-phosphoribosyl)anthranilate isomerase [Sulfuracidifex tepidarius]BBG26571.1 N-(5'-phosphoribosyl)anthranilate isomerase [Sulfuracidifex tepidarius]